MLGRIQWRVIGNGLSCGRCRGRLRGNRIGCRLPEAHVGNGRTSALEALGPPVMTIIMGRPRKRDDRAALRSQTPRNRSRRSALRSTPVVSLAPRNKSRRRSGSLTMTSVGRCWCSVLLEERPPQVQVHHHREGGGVQKGDADFRQP